MTFQITIVKMKNAPIDPKISKNQQKNRSYLMIGLIFSGFQGVMLTSIHFVISAQLM